MHGKVIEDILLKIFLTLIDCLVCFWTAASVKYSSDRGIPPVASATLKNARNEIHGLDNRGERKQNASCCHCQKFLRKQISHQIALKTIIVIRTCLQFGDCCILLVNIIWIMADGNSLATGY